MRVVGLGIDLVERSRVEGQLARWGDRLVGKLMGPEEASLLPLPAAERCLALARAIVAKEAASKALGTGWSHGVRWRDVVLVGGPAVRLSGGAAAAAAALGSGGDSVNHIEERGDLVLGEVRLLG
jgi:holo-[acyl-carrier protein] synthase